MFKQDEIIWQNEVLEMAKESGIWESYPDSWSLEKFAKLIAAKEREACAKVCEEVGEHPSLNPLHCAESIRARGTEA